MCAQVYISLSIHYHGIKLGGSMMFLMAFRCMQGFFSVAPLVGLHMIAETLEKCYMRYSGLG